MYRISVLFELGYGVNDMLGDAFATPSKSVMPRFVNISADNAEIAIGVSCRLASRRSAVTTISSSAPDDDDDDDCVPVCCCASAAGAPRTAIVPPAIHAERKASLSFIDISPSVTE